MTIADSFDDRFRCFVRVSFERVRNGRNISRPGNHLLDYGTLIGMANAVGTIMMSWGNDSTRKWRTERPRLHDENLNTKGLELIGKRFMDSFNSKFTSGIRSSSRAGYEAISYSIRTTGILQDNGLKTEGGLTYPAPLLMRTRLPEPFARMTGRHARTVRRGP